MIMTRSRILQHNYKFVGCNQTLPRLYSVFNNIVIEKKNVIDKANICELAKQILSEFVVISFIQFLKI